MVVVVVGSGPGSAKVSEYVAVVLLGGVGPEADHRGGGRLAGLSPPQSSEVVVVVHLAAVSDLSADHRGGVGPRPITAPASELEGVVHLVGRHAAGWQGLPGPLPGRHAAGWQGLPGPLPNWPGGLAAHSASRCHLGIGL